MDTKAEEVMATDKYLHITNSQTDRQIDRNITRLTNKYTVPLGMRGTGQ